MQRYATKVGKRFREVSTRTLVSVSAYSWPGNIRELQNVIERAVILSDGDVFSVDEPGSRGARRAVQVHRSIADAADAA